MREFVKTTKPFESTFLNLQRDEVPATSNVFSFSYGLRIGLKLYLEDPSQLESYAEDILKELSTRFVGIDDDELYLAATFLGCKDKLQ